MPLDLINIDWREELLDKSVLSQLILGLVEYNREYFLMHETVKWLLQCVCVPYIYYYFANKLARMVNASKSKIYQRNLVDAEKIVNDVIGMGIKNIDIDNEDIVANKKEAIKKAWNKFCYEVSYDKSCGLEEVSANIISILRYVDNFLRPAFRIASFSYECNMSYMWGEYAKAQNGVCMKFQTITCGTRKTLDFDNEGIKNEVLFEDVRYDDNLDTYETAFNLLGFLNEHANGKISNELMKQCKVPYLRKLKGWEHEKETRLIIRDYGDDFCKLKYKFSSLKSIYWGMNVAYEDRRKMVSIIRNKCEENGIKAFDFYEYSYSDKDWYKKPAYRIEL